MELTPVSADIGVPIIEIIYTSLVREYVYMISIVPIIPLFEDIGTQNIGMVSFIIILCTIYGTGLTHLGKKGS